jgi:LacI family transcriptional regulator
VSYDLSPYGADGSGAASALDGAGAADGVVLDGADGRGGAPASPGSALSQPPTIYDVARVAGVSIASVSRVLNGRRNPRPETRDRVLQAVTDLGFVPDGAARALSARLKEVVGVVVRRPVWHPNDMFADEDENLQFPDMINRGMEIVAQQHGFDLLIRSVGLDERDAARRIFALARKSDGIILHDRVLSPAELARLARQVPVVTLAGVPTPETANVHSDNEAGMRELAHHLIADHGYRTLGYLAGHGDSPDSLNRGRALAEAAAAAGVTLLQGEAWRGSYQAAESARAIEALIEAGVRLPDAIVCANDQSAIGVLHALAQHGIAVPGDVAVTGFDDIPVARHLRPQLTTVRQSILDMGATAFETLYAMIGREPGQHGDARGQDIALATRLVRRESCGCGPQPGGPQPGGPQPGGPQPGGPQPGGPRGEQGAI